MKETSLEREDSGSRTVETILLWKKRLQRKHLKDHNHISTILLERGRGVWGKLDLLISRNQTVTLPKLDAEPTVRCASTFPSRHLDFSEMTSLMAGTRGREGRHRVENQPVPHVY